MKLVKSPPPPNTATLRTGNKTAILDKTAVKGIIQYIIQSRKTILYKFIGLENQRQYWGYDCDLIKFQFGKIVVQEINMLKS